MTPTQIANVIKTAIAAHPSVRSFWLQNKLPERLCQRLAKQGITAPIKRFIAVANALGYDIVLTPKQK